MSLVLSIVLPIIHIAAIVLVIYLWGESVISLILIFAILLAGFLVTKSYAFRGFSTSVMQLQQQENNVWRIQLKSGEILYGKLAGENYISDVLLILRIKIWGRRRLQKVIIMRDSVSHDEYRHMKMWMLQGG